MNTVTAQDIEIQPVPLQATLLIQAGGTGERVGTRTRRLVAEHFGSLDNMPIFRSIYIDTDHLWFENSHSRVEADVRLSRSEFCDLGVNDLSGLYEGVRRGELDNYTWLSERCLHHYSNIKNGAGAIRQLGRLGLFCNFGQVREKLAPAIRQLTAQAASQEMRDRYGIAVDPGICVHIVASLAGGTGSGIVWDLAYYVRHLLREMGVQGNVQINGYLVLPQAFKGTDAKYESAKANAYAALLELNYYSYVHAPQNPKAGAYGVPIFEADYLGRGQGRIRFEGKPPFDCCYLLGASNEHVNLERSAIFDMVAHAIFHELTLSFATFKRSLRANIRNLTVGNDGCDYPIGFMSFGQSQFLCPWTDVRQILSLRLAERALLCWSGATEADLPALREDNSLDRLANAEPLKREVRAFINGEFKDRLGFGTEGILGAILTDQNARLTDKPVRLQEDQKAQWLAERWYLESYSGKVNNSWKLWRAEFSDESADPVKWGVYMRQLDTNRQTTERKLKKATRSLLDQMFEDTADRGPAFTLCVIRQLQSYLTNLKAEFLRVANDANAIANLLSNLHLLHAISGTHGPSMTAIIEQRIGQEFDLLLQAQHDRNPFGKRQRIEARAYEYLTWCGLWCRARVEERARRLAAQLADALIEFLAKEDRRLLDQADTLSRLRADVTALTSEWQQKASQTPVVGTLLYSPEILGAVEQAVRARQGDRYDPARVAEAALVRLGKGLGEVTPEDVPTLRNLLLEEAQAAIGDGDARDDQGTLLAAHDLLGLQAPDDRTLEKYLQATVEQAAPFALLAPYPRGGGWSPNKLHRAAIVGLRGGVVDNDQDPSRKRIIAALGRIEVDVRNHIHSIESSNQIVFFCEFGGFPLRALQGIEELRDAYLHHRREQPGIPLHIVRDELACFPDLIQISSEEPRRVPKGLWIDLDNAANRPS